MTCLIYKAILLRLQIEKKNLIFDKKIEQAFFSVMHQLTVSDISFYEL